MSARLKLLDVTRYSAFLHDRQQVPSLHLSTGSHLYSQFLHASGFQILLLHHVIPRFHSLLSSPHTLHPQALPHWLLWCQCRNVRILNSFSSILLIWLTWMKFLIVNLSTIQNFSCFLNYLYLWHQFRLQNFLFRS